MNKIASKIRCFLKYEKVAAAFFGRNGGVTKGECGSLNCGFKPYLNSDETLLNRQTVAREMGQNFEQKIFGVSQKHTSDVHILTHDNLNESVQADAIITKVPNILIGVLTADCCPIMVYAPDTNIIAAIHAGWRGALGNEKGIGIIENTVGELANFGCKIANLEVAIGPCIAKENYEIDQDFKDRFIAVDQIYDRFFHDYSNNKKQHFDLKSFVEHKLNKIGISAIDTSAVRDTFANADQYFSSRRFFKNCKKDQPLQFGVQTSVIGLNS